MSFSFPSGYSSNLSTSVRENYLIRLYNEDGNFIALALEDTTVNSIDYDGVLQKVPTVRESINLKEASSSLSNVSLSCINFNFSSSGNVSLPSAVDLDQELLFGTNNYINREVRIYSQLENNATEGNLFLIFKGRLKSVSSENQIVSMDISPLNPLKDLVFPTAKTEDGLYSPIVFGDYTSQNDAYPHQSLLGLHRTYPVEVATQANGHIYTIMPNAGSTASAGSGLMHYNESELIRKGSSTTLLSELMAQCNGAEIINNSGQTPPIISAQSGTIYLRGTPADLARTIDSELLVSSGDFTITNAYTPAGSLTLSGSTTTEDVTYSKSINFENFGTLQHTPSSIVFKMGFAHAITLTRSGGSSTGVITSVNVFADVYWEDVAGSADETFTLHTGTIAVGGLSSTLSATTLSQRLDNSSHANNNGNMPQKIIVRLVVVYEGSLDGGGATNTLGGTATLSTSYTESTTKLVTDNSTVQTDSEIKSNIKKLYSSQDGLQLSSTLIKKPIVAHRYLLETFAPDTFTSSNRGDGYADLKTYFELFSSQGDMNYWQHKQEKLEDKLKELQHFGFFIGRFRADGTYEYISPHYITYDVDSTSNPNGIYLTHKGTTTTTNFTALSLVTNGQGFGLGELIAVKEQVTVLGTAYDAINFMQITSASPITGGSSTQTIASTLLDPFSTYPITPTSSMEIYTVTLPHATIDKDDFSKIKVSHTPFDDLVTKWTINYHRDPADDSNYLKQLSSTNTAARTAYNIEDEDIQEIENPYDSIGSLATTNYYEHYNNLIGQPRLKVSIDLVNPEFFDMEVGDIFRVNPEPQNFFGKNYLTVYFMVTQTTRTLGKFSISGYQII